MRKILLLLILGLLPFLGLEAQNFVPTEVKISTEKVNISGKLFYIHKILKGQTLYSISKKYNVPQDVIIAQNPNIKYGLKSNSVIYIPVKNSPSTTQNISSSTNKTSSYLSKQIPKKTVEDSKTQDNPKKSNTPQNTISKRDLKSKYKRYSVKWYETIFDIADKFNTSAEAIRNLNNLEPNQPLKKRQKLYIPDKNYIIGQYKTVKKEEPKTNTTVKNNEDYFSEYSNDGNNQQNDDSFLANFKRKNIYQYTKDRTYKISVILPLDYSNNIENTNASYMDFYNGIQLAVKDAKTKMFLGDLQINIIDMKKYQSAEDLIYSGRLNGSELIIGPVYYGNISALSEYAKENKIPIISPLTPTTEKLAKNNPFFFQYSTSDSILTANMYKALVKETAGKKVTVIYEKGTEDSQLVKSSLLKLQNNYIPYDTISYGILEGRNIRSVISDKLGADTINFILVPSINEAFVSDVTRNLYLLKTGARPEEEEELEKNSNYIPEKITERTIYLYGEPEWKDFEKVEVQYFHELNLHLFLHYYVDYTDFKTAKFAKNYQESFNTQPTPFAFQGYDITSFFLNQLNINKRSFPAYITNYEKEHLLQSNVKFIKLNNNSGFINEATRDIIYKNPWKIEVK